MMKPVKDYLNEAQRVAEPLPKLLERVQREAFEAGVNASARQFFAIAHATEERTAHMTSSLLGQPQHG